MAHRLLGRGTSADWAQGGFLKCIVPLTITFYAGLVGCHSDIRVLAQHSIWQDLGSGRFVTYNWNYSESPQFKYFQTRDRFKRKTFHFSASPPFLTGLYWYWSRSGGFPVYSISFYPRVLSLQIHNIIMVFMKIFLGKLTILFVHDRKKTSEI